MVDGQIGEDPRRVESLPAQVGRERPTAERGVWPAGDGVTAVAGVAQHGKKRRPAEWRRNEKPRRGGALVGADGGSYSSAQPPITWAMTLAQTPPRNCRRWGPPTWPRWLRLSPARPSSAALRRSAHCARGFRAVPGTRAAARAACRPGCSGRNRSSRWPASSPGRP